MIARKMAMTIRETSHSGMVLPPADRLQRRHDYMEPGHVAQLLRLRLPFAPADAAVQGRTRLRATFTERPFDESDDVLAGVVYQRLIEREIEKQLAHVPQHVRHEGLPWRQAGVPDFR
jgi:hypothetical protein